MRPNPRTRFLAPLLVLALLLVAAPAFAWAWFHLSPFLPGITVEPGESSSAGVLAQRDAECDQSGTLTFAKVSGPSWSSVSSWGLVTASPPVGTPLATYYITVRATGVSSLCGTHVEDATMQIRVK